MFPKMLEHIYNRFKLKISNNNSSQRNKFYIFDLIFINISFILNCAFVLNCAFLKIYSIFSCQIATLLRKIMPNIKYLKLCTII